MISTRILAAAAFAAGLVVTGPASAHTAPATAVGVGTISPGLPTQGCTSGQAVHFEGTAAHGTTTGNVAFDGTSSICESLGAGAGSGTLSGAVTGLVNYTRTGNVVTLSGNVVVDGANHTISGGACVFAPTSVNPVTTYALACLLVLS